MVQLDHGCRQKLKDPGGSSTQDRGGAGSEESFELLASWIGPKGAGRGVLVLLVSLLGSLPLSGVGGRWVAHVQLGCIVWYRCWVI